MKKISKNLISTFFCSTMALGLMLGLTNVTSSKMVQANASPIAKANDILPEVYRPYDLTLTTDSIIFKEDVNVSDNVTRWDMFILAGSSGETAPIRVDINEFDAEGFKLYDGYCIKANGASEDSANPGGTFKKLDADTFEITINPSKINGVKFLGDDKPYIWLVVAPCNPINRLDQIKGTPGHFDVYNSTICLGKFGSIDNFKMVTTLVTIADIMPAHFPIRINSDMPENPWLNENRVKLYLISNGTITKLQFDGQGISAGGFAIDVSKEVTANNENYIYNYINGYCSATITFYMLNDKLDSVNLINYSGSKESDTLFNGTYDGILVHTLKETHDKVEPTCTVAGHQAYYECDCGAYLSNSDLTEEISDLDAWLAEGGDGYIAPQHNFGKVEYTWVGTQCTASRKCQRDGCTETQSELASIENGKVVYVKDFDATCTANEKGHYEATFTVQEFEKQATSTFDVPNTAKGHNYGTPTYTWNEDYTKCTATATCSHGDSTITNEGTITIEDGYAVATFEDDIFESQRVKLPEPAPEKSGLSGGAIAGIAIGCLFLLLLVIYLIGYFFLYRKGKLDEKKIKVIYKFLPRGEKNLKEDDK